MFKKAKVTMIGKNIIENLISDVMKFSWVQINGNSLKVERIWKLKEESGCRKSFLRVLLRSHICRKREHTDLPQSLANIADISDIKDIEQLFTLQSFYYTLPPIHWELFKSCYNIVAQGCLLWIDISHRRLITCSMKKSNAKFSKRCFSGPFHLSSLLSKTK